MRRKPNTRRHSIGTYFMSDFIKISARKSLNFHYCSNSNWILFLEKNNVHSCWRINSGLGGFSSGLFQRGGIEYRKVISAISKMQSSIIKSVFDFQKKTP